MTTRFRQREDRNVNTIDLDHHKHPSLSRKQKHGNSIIYYRSIYW